jgi:plasmid stability protein
MWYSEAMATLTIRNLPAAVHEALRRQAAAHSRSMEAEAREVLQNAVARRPSEATRKAALARLRSMKPLVDRGEPPGWSVVDEFLAEKHLDSAWENARVTDQERTTWRARLERFEVWPSEVEAFLEGRRRGAPE